MTDKQHHDISLLNEQEKKKRGIIGRAVDTAVPLAAGYLAYKGLSAKPSPGSAGATPRVIPPKEPTPRLKPTPLEPPNTLEPYFKQPESTVHKTLSDPGAYKNIQLKQPKGSLGLGGRGRRQRQVQQTQDIASRQIKLRGKRYPEVGPQTIAQQRQQAGGGYTHGTLGYEPTVKTAAQIQRERDLASAKKLGDFALGGMTMAMPGTGGARVGQGIVRGVKAGAKFVRGLSRTPGAGKTAGIAGTAGAASTANTKQQAAPKPKVKKVKTSQEIQRQQQQNRGVRN